MTLTFDPRSPISIGFEPVQLATASKLVHPFSWILFSDTHTHTHTQTDRQTKVKNITHPRFHGGVKREKIKFEICIDVYKIINKFFIKKIDLLIYEKIS